MESGVKATKEEFKQSFDDRSIVPRGSSFQRCRDASAR